MGILSGPYGLLIKAVGVVLLLGAIAGYSYQAGSDHGYEKATGFYQPQLDAYKEAEIQLALKLKAAEELAATDREIAKKKAAEIKATYDAKINSMNSTIIDLRKPNHEHHQENEQWLDGVMPSDIIDSVRNL